MLRWLHSTAAANAEGGLSDVFVKSTGRSDTQGCAIVLPLLQESVRVVGVVCKRETVSISGSTTAWRVAGQCL